MTPYPEVAIVNPCSAGGRTGRRLTTVKSLLARARSAPVEWRITTRPGEASEIARAALERGTETIFSVGGDGTHHEVLQGFFTKDGEPVNSHAAFGVIQSGTGGDLCRSLGTAGSLKPSIRALASAHAQPLDIGRIEFIAHDGAFARRYFINVASAGIAGLVDTYMASTRLRFLGGTVAFYAATVQAFLHFRSRPASVSVDNGLLKNRTIVNIVAANGRYFGGGMKVAPQASMADGLLDIVTFGDFSMPEFLIHGLSLYRGTHFQLAKVSFCRAKSLDIRSVTETLLDIDGECPGRLPARIECLPGAIRALAC